MPRYRLRALLIVLALTTLSVRSASAVAEEKGLNGRWKVVAAMSGGKPTTDAIAEFAIFSDTQYVEEDRLGRLTDRGTVKVDWTVKPATIDVRSRDGFVNRGVFELRGDSLEICWGYEKRPQSLDSSKDAEFFHVIFARVTNR